MNTSKEIKEQAKAFAQLRGDTLKLIAKYAVEFREIIDGYEKMHGKEPSAEDILWIASEHHKHNIREDMNEEDN